MDVVEWQTELRRSHYDSSVGIRVVRLAGDAAFSTYMTVIDPGKTVRSHYHRRGDEHYHIISGKGEITFTDVATGRTTMRAINEQSSFVVPERTLHQLCNSGDEPLVLMFSCPDSHLNEDRFFS